METEQRSYGEEEEEEEKSGSDHPSEEDDLCSIRTCQNQEASNGERGCTFCGGLGHRITDCPKLEAMQTKQVTNIGRKDYLAHSSMDF